MPAPPLEMYLRRAETVVLVQVVSVDGQSVTLRCTASLRGGTKVASTLSLEWHGLPIQVGAEFLLLSQGDAHYGPPPPVTVSFGTKGQGGWLGWLPFPISKAGGQTYAEGVYSHADGKMFIDAPPGDSDWKLSLPYIKRLLDLVPYDPHVSDKLDAPMQPAPGKAVDPSSNRTDGRR